MGNLAEAPGQIHDGVDRTSSTLSEKNRDSFPGMPFLDGRACSSGTCHRVFTVYLLQEPDACISQVDGLLYRLNIMGDMGYVRTC